MKKFSLVVFCALLAISLLSGCGASNAPLNRSPESDELYAGDDFKGILAQSAEDNSGSMLAQPNTEIAVGEIASNRKIIKNAEIECSADDVQQKYQTILTWLKENGGSEFRQEMTTRDEYCKINAVFKIVPEKLDTLIEMIGKNTEIINKNISANDITEEYVDIELSLKSKRAALNQYYVMLEKASTVDEILSIQRVINDYTAEIEKMEGKISFWDHQVSEATISVSFYQTNDPLKPKPVSFNAMSFGSMLEYIGSGFVSVINVVFAILQWLLIILLSISPLIVIALVVIFTVRFIIKSKKKKKAG